MHYDEGHLLAYLDGELDEGTHEEVAAHLAGCETCTSTVVRLEEERALAAEAFAPLHAASEREPVDADAAYARMETERTAQAQQIDTAVASTGVHERDDARRAPVTPWYARIGWGQTAAAAAVVLVVASLAFAPVREAAADLLRVFRVEDVGTFSVTQDELEDLSAAFETAEGHVELESLGEAQISGSHEPEAVTLEAAQAAVDFPIVLPEGIDATPTVHLMGASTIEFELDVERMNELLAYFGSERTFPDELDGEVFSVTTHPVVTIGFAPDGTALPAAGVTEHSGTMVAMSRGPELTVPDGVDPDELRDILVGLPILPDDLREQLASSEDWQSTLLIPNVDGSARDITIAGVDAVVVTPHEYYAPPGAETDTSASQYAAVIWQQDGVIVTVGGDMDEDTAISLAESMLR